LIVETLKSEERKFQNLLERGLRLLDDELAGLSADAALPGEAAFKLYDTYGFPLDLTQDALRRQGRSVDTDGFDAAMAEQKRAARAAWAGSGDAADERIWFDVAEKAGATEFIGYIHDTAEGVVQAMMVEGALVEEARAGDTVEVVVNQTPFYAESGGQIGDAGVIETDSGARIAVSDVRKRAGVLFAHIGKVEDGALRREETVHLKIDAARRNRTRANHSATHLMHAALREVLGEHVVQKGSLVTPERLRFDFTNPNPMSDEDIAKVEESVNAVIRDNDTVSTRIMGYDDAVASGAIALFGEKYDSDVRVLTMGNALDGTDKPYSVELCGGTHVNRLGDIALFKIIGESAVSAGVRRVEAMTGEAARLRLIEDAAAARAAADALKTTLADLPERVQTLAAERRRLEREVQEAKKALALAGGGAQQADEIREIAGVKFVGRVLDGVAPKDLRGLIDEAKAKMGEGVAAFVGVNEGKAALAVGVTPALQEKISAVDLVRAGSQAVGGKGGGGRPDMAQAGGPDGTNADAAIEAIEKSLAAVGDSVA
ncbi:MAG: alanine--tRNA ligase-related protein, partial [Pseudomonadota bacterium]